MSNVLENYGYVLIQRWHLINSKIFSGVIIQNMQVQNSTTTGSQNGSQSTFGKPIIICSVNVLGLTE